MLQTGIVMLTQIYLIAHDGAALHAPRRVAGDDLARAVLILDLDLAHESRRAVAQRRPILNHVIETVAENRAHGIGTLAQQRLQVVAYVHDRIFTEWIRHYDRTRTQFRAAVVVCLVGRQVILAHAAAVNIELEVPQTRAVEAGRAYRLPDRELTAQQRRRHHVAAACNVVRLLALPRRSDPLAAPLILREQARMPMRRRTPLRGAPLLVPHHHLPPV